MSRQTKRRQRKPPGYWDVKANRVRAVRELAAGLDKPYDKFRKNDFLDNGLSTLLAKYNGSVKKALIEAELASPRIKKPAGYWDIKENRVQAVRDLIEYRVKSVEKIRKKDFVENGLSVLLKDRSMKEVIEEAGYTYVEAQKPHGYWNTRENCRKEVRDLVSKLGKSPNEITKQDFIDNGLSTLLNKYRGSLSRALQDAGFKEVTRKRVPFGWWEVKDNRVAATRKLYEQLGRTPEQLSRRDFEERGLSTLLTKYKADACKNFARGDDPFTYDEGYLLRYKNEVYRALAEAEIIP